MRLLLKYLFLVIAMTGYACMVFECFEKEREQNYQKETHDYLHTEKTTFQKQVIHFPAEVRFAESLLQYRLISASLKIFHTIGPAFQHEYLPDKLFLRFSVLLI